MAKLWKAALLAGLVLLAACKDDNGPVDVQYGREACENCGMLISDPHYATELRGGADNHVHKFDDMGDAVLWLDRKSGWSQTDLKEFWVMNSDDAKTWLDARKAFYVRASTPMDYGFSAVPDQRDGAITFEEMRQTILARGATNMCDPKDSPKDSQSGGVKP